MINHYLAQKILTLQHTGSNIHSQMRIRNREKVERYTPSQVARQELLMAAEEGINISD